jgi:hypothetical protein
MKKVFIACLFLVAAIPALRAGEPTPCRADVAPADYSAPRDGSCVVFALPAVIAGLTALEAAGLIALSVPTGYCLFKVAEGVASGLEDLVVGDYIWVESRPDGFDPSNPPPGDQPQWLKGMARLLAGSLALGEMGKGLYIASRSSGRDVVTAQQEMEEQLTRKGFAPYGYHDENGTPVASGLVFRADSWNYVVRNADGWFQFQVMQDQSGRTVANTPQRISARDGRAVARKVMINSPSWPEGLANIANDVQNFQSGRATRAQLERLNAFADGDCFNSDACLRIKGDFNSVVENALAHVMAHTATQTDWVVLADFMFMEFATPELHDLQHRVYDIMPVEDWAAIEPLADDAPQPPGQITFWRRLQIQQNLPTMCKVVKDVQYTQAAVNAQEFIGSIVRDPSAQQRQQLIENRTSGGCKNPVRSSETNWRTGAFWDVRLRGVKSPVNLFRDGWNLLIWNRTNPDVLFVYHCVGRDYDGLPFESRWDLPHNELAQVDPATGKKIPSGHGVHFHWSEYGKKHSYKGCVPQGVVVGHPMNDFGFVYSESQMGYINRPHFGCTHPLFNALGALQVYAAINACKISAGIPIK